MNNGIHAVLWIGIHAVAALPLAANAGNVAGTGGTLAAAPVVRRVVTLGTRAIRAEAVTKAAGAASIGKPGDAATMRLVALTVSDLYKARGFSVAQVVASDLSDDGTLTLTVAEGTIRRVLVRGNTKTMTGVIETAVDLKAGDVYREDAVRDARNRLSRLGIFEEVIIVGALESEEPKSTPNLSTSPLTPAVPDPADSPTDSKAPAPAAPSEAPRDKAESVQDEVGFVDLIVRVKERRTGNIAATVGYNDGSGILGFIDFSENNVYGTASRASIQWQRTNTSRFTSNGDFIEGRTRSAYLVSYDVPAIGPHSTAFGAQVYNTNTVFLPFFSNNRDNLRNYELRKGGNARIGRGIGRGATVYLTGRHDQVGYDAVPDSLNPPINEILNANATVSAVGVNLILDGRDDAINPRHGFLHNIAYERAERFLGGDRFYAGLTADLRSYLSLGASPKSPMLATRFLGGAVGDNAPLSEQYWLGGYDLLRGYDLFSIHGTRVALASTEYRVPLGPGFQGVVFAEAGNAFASGESVKLTNLRGSGGLGVRFLTPIGPIRLDVAYGNRLQTYVSLGQSY